MTAPASVIRRNEGRPSYSTRRFCTNQRKDLEHNRRMMSPSVLLTSRPNAMVGRTVSHYQILGELGAGGMGVVYSAVDSRLGRPVALKFVSHDLSNDEQAILRLRS